MWKRFISGLVCFALCGCLCSCSHTSHLIAYTVYPIGWLLEQIGGNTITIESVQTDTLVQKSTAVDSFTDILSGAAVYMHIGDLEPYQSVQEDNISTYAQEDLDLSTAGGQYDFARYTRKADGTVEETEYYEDASFDDVDVCEKEQAFWLDPIAMLSMGRMICSWLQEKYPDHSDYYQENMDALAAELIDLDGEYQNLAASLEKNDQTIRFVTMSNGFGILQNAYRFEVYPVVLSRYGVLPNEIQLEKIKERIVEDDVKYIVYEPNMSDDMKELFSRLEDELGLTRVELSNLFSLSAQQEEDGKDYLSLMEDNLLVLETMETSDLKE
jgi:ABC-type Zn uptake system ZnuABC Zn-binding protein ZnuA